MSSTSGRPRGSAPTITRLPAHHRPVIDAALSSGERFVVGDASLNSGAAVVSPSLTRKGDTRMTADSDQDTTWVRPGRERSGTQKNLSRRRQQGAVSNTPDGHQD